MVNNRGLISRGTVNVRDAAPGVYAAGGEGRGPARARCARQSDVGRETRYSDLPCQVGNDAELYTIILYGTGWRFGSETRVRFRFEIGNGEEDEVELAPSYAGPYRARTAKSTSAWTR